MPIDRVYLCPSTLTVPIARYPLPRDVSLTLSFRSLSLPLPLFTAPRPVTSRNRPVGCSRARVPVLFQLLLHLLLLLPRTSFTPTSPPPFPSPNRLRARLSIFFLHRTASKLFFLSAHSLPPPTRPALQPYLLPSSSTPRRRPSLPTRPRSKIVVSFLHPAPLTRPLPPHPANPFTLALSPGAPVSRLRPCLPPYPPI